MKRQTILTILVILLIAGMLVAVADPVFAVGVLAALAGITGTAAATLIPVSIEYPAQNR